MQHDAAFHLRLHCLPNIQATSKGSDQTERMQPGLSLCWSHIPSCRSSFVPYSLLCLCNLVAYIANNMDPDQIAPLGTVCSGFIVFASMIKLVCSTFKYMRQTSLNQNTFSGQKNILT